MNKATLILCLHLEHDAHMELSTLKRERNRVSHDNIMRAYNKLWIAGGYNYIRLTDAELIAIEKKAKRESAIDEKIAVIREKQDSDYQIRYRKAQDAKLARYAIAEKELYSLFDM